MAVVNLTGENFKAETSQGLVLVDFYADWCGPCKMLAPVLDELANEVTDVKISKVNVDSAKELAVEFGVSTIPNITFLKDGKIVHQDIGYKPKEVLLSLIDSYR
ncbi:MAG: thioredoxin [Defluviitaleaceae bacterium]|nr:thioredoxin [Defluviitaleaceae bacterium]